jgi:hypothetical protein
MGKRGTERRIFLMVTQMLLEISGTEKMTFTYIVLTSGDHF